MGVLYIASAQSNTGLLGRVSDWGTHGLAYLVLGALLCRALAGGFSRPLSLPLALLGVAIGTLYGVSDEYHQSFVPRRHSSAMDVVKDALGCSIAAAYHVTRTRSPSR